MLEPAETLQEQIERHEDTARAVGCCIGAAALIIAGVTLAKLAGCFA